MKIEEYRIGTLKRCEVEIKSVLDYEDLLSETRLNLNDLLRQIKIALGEEIGTPRRL